MNDLLRHMLRYHGIGEAMIFADRVAANSLYYRWIRRAAARAEMSLEAQHLSMLRAKFEVRA